MELLSGKEVGLYMAQILWTMILIVSFIMLNLTSFKFFQKALNVKYKKIIVFIPILINCVAVVLIDMFLIEARFNFVILAVLVSIEFKFIFRVSIEKCLLISGIIFLHVSGCYLLIFSSFSYFSKTSTDIIRENAFYMLIIYSFVFVFSSLFIFLWRVFWVEKDEVIMKNHVFLRMAYVIVWFMIISMSLDTIFLLAEKIELKHLMITFASVVFYIAIFYQLYFLISTFVDIHIYRSTERNLQKEVYIKFKEEQNLLEIVNRDDLTNLYNRKYAMRLLDRMCKEYENMFYIFVFDINGLKKINDTFGHSEGDQYILNMTACIKKSFRHNDFVARIGGDEFMVICSKMNEREAQNALKRLEETTKKTNLRERKYRSSMSIGYVLVTKENADKGAGFILGTADLKMNVNKQKFYSGGKKT